MWITIQSESNLPKESGTKAVVYHGSTAWMYWNLESKTWHPVRGWRCNIGQPWKDVTAYMELPSYAYQLKMEREWDEVFSDENKARYSALGTDGLSVQS